MTSQFVLYVHAAGASHAPSQGASLPPGAARRMWSQRSAPGGWSWADAHVPPGKVPARVSACQLEVDTTVEDIANRAEVKWASAAVCLAVLQECWRSIVAKRHSCDVLCIVLTPLQSENLSRIRQTISYAHTRF